MYQYPKSIQTNEQLLKKWSDAGMIIEPDNNAIEVLDTIGYYRLKGYSFHFYNKVTGRYQEGTSFSDIVKLYHFDFRLSHLVFSFLSQIEVSLRARFVSALLLHNDPLILNDPSIFRDKEDYWKNQSNIASEIARSKDVFIIHNFDNYDGAIPLWAVVEVMSFGTLSKVIKNLKTETAAYNAIVQHYRFTSLSGNLIVPSKDMLTSWVQSVSVLRNICAHNSRIYNKVISTTPRLIDADKVNPQPRYNGVYQILLAMKYLRPSDEKWNSFETELENLIKEYSCVVDISRLNFAADWPDHLRLPRSHE